MITRYDNTIFIIPYSCSCRNPAIFRFPSTIYNEDNRDHRVPTNYITFIIIYVMGRYNTNYLNYYNTNLDLGENIKTTKIGSNTMIIRNYVISILYFILDYCNL